MSLKDDIPSDPLSPRASGKTASSQPDTYVEDPDEGPTRNKSRSGSSSGLSLETTPGKMSGLLLAAFKPPVGIVGDIISEMITQRRVNGVSIAVGRQKLLDGEVWPVFVLTITAAGKIR
jgi:hypothetical protein